MEWRGPQRGEGVVEGVEVRAAGEEVWGPAVQRCLW